MKKLNTNTLPNDVEALKAMVLELQNQRLERQAETARIQRTSCKAIAGPCRWMAIKAMSKLKLNLLVDGHMPDVSSWMLKPCKEERKPPKPMTCNRLTT